MLSLLGALLQRVVETPEPQVELLEAFSGHWRGITGYYLEATDALTPARQTDIPWRLRQLLDIVVHEERLQPGGAGPCMQYLLQQGVLECLGVLGRAEYPPGMRQQVLLFFTRLLGQLQHPLLRYAGVRRAVQKLLQLSAHLQSCGTEKEEAQFAAVLCAKVKEDPELLPLLLEDKSGGSEAAGHEGERGAELHPHSAERPSRGAGRQPRSTELHQPRGAGRQPCSAEDQPLGAKIQPRSAQHQLQSAELHAQGAGRQPHSTQHRPQGAGHPQGAELQPQGTELHPHSAEIQPHSAEHRSRSAGHRPQSAELHPQRAELRPQSTELQPQSAEHPRCTEHQAQGTELHPQGAASLWPPAHPSHPPRDANLITALVKLCGSQRSRVALKARDSLLLLVGLSMEPAPSCLVRSSALCKLLAEHLCHLYSTVPHSTAPADVLAVGRVSWRSQCGAAALSAFLCWLDFVDELVLSAQPLLADAVAADVQEKFFVGVLRPQLLQLSELALLGPTAVLTAVVRQLHAPALLHRLLLLLLGPPGTTKDPPDPLRVQLIQRCDHPCHELSTANLRLFEELLQKPHKLVPHSLVLQNLETRGYLQRSPPAPPEQEPDEDTLDLEEDPYFTDGFPAVGFGVAKRSGSGSPLGTGHVGEVVSSFLCLVPEEAKTSMCTEGSGWDSYVCDATAMVQKCRANAALWGWPQSPRPLELCPPEGRFYEGLFLQVLFDRLARILDQPYSLNLQLTSVLSLLAALPHPHLHEYLLDPYLSLAPGVRSLFSILIRVMGDLMQRIQSIPDFRAQLVLVRRQLMGLEPGEQTEQAMLFQGVVVLEEFCKELAAIALVKSPPQGPP